jgi:hypothetical protein
MLSLVTFYTLFSASVIVVHVRSLTKQRLVENASSVQSSVSALQTRSANMRQLLGATFYFFGFVFFLTLPAATFTIELSRTPAVTSILRNFLMDFAFAANVFFVLLALHFVQWFVSGRVRARALLLNTQTFD